ncbi:MAG: DUF1343 domain-containing protein [Sulfobacillus acidophilus]|uniref:DUF1343 domain-containing protein n=1 Tax=Sulfobacillus acidophilus TaxID=53633 RepID=A0A2T2WJY4_9FIRM|nr:MAG: DUF1343 domain-containing protein [Sulfobacillus acidophilus]
MVALGIDQLMSHHHALIADKRLGLITNYAMTDAHLLPVIDRLQRDRSTCLVRLFGPEHGVRNAAKEGDAVIDAVDAHSGLPAVSLYGVMKAPSPDMLSDLDVLVIDLQDIGSRYYTNASTLYHALESAAQAHIRVVVLDRPNPIGGVRREGHVLDPAYQSFVGMLPVPIRHGLTFAEEARLIQSMFFPQIQLEVVPMQGWTRSMLFPDTGLPFVSPSPNTTGFDMTLLYCGTCLFEGTNVSVGRGTTHPFEWIGAPWVDGHQLADWFNAQHLAGVKARPVYFTPWRSLYAGDLVQGVQLHVVAAQQVHSLKVGVTLLNAFCMLYPQSFQIQTNEDGARPFFDLLAGGSQLRECIESGRTAEYFAQEPDVIAQFEKDIAPYLLYV